MHSKFLPVFAFLDKLSGKLEIKFGNSNVKTSKPLRTLNCATLIYSHRCYLGIASMVTQHVDMLLSADWAW